MLLSKKLICFLSSKLSWLVLTWENKIIIIWRKIIAVIYATYAAVKRKPEKNSGLYGIWSLDLCSAVPIKLTSRLGAGRWIGSAVHICDFNIFITSSSSFHGFVTNRFNHHDWPWFSHVHNFKVIIIIVSSWVSLHKSFEYRRQIFNELTIFNVQALRCEHWFARDCLWIYILFLMLKD